MNDYQNHKSQLFEAFIRSAQYIVRLNAKQDVWEHLGKLIVTHFPADWTIFAQRDPRQGIILHHSALPDEFSAEQILTEEVRALIEEVLESGFLASQLLAVPESSMTVFLPVMEEYQTTGVMLIGHKSIDPLPKDLLDVYLAIAGLAGTAFERLHNERELSQHRDRLEDLVKERTADLNKAKRQNELILNTVREGICGLDLAGRITFINPCAAQILGWESAELIGRSAHDTFHHTRSNGSRYPAESCPLHTTLTSGDSGYVSNEDFVRRDGTQFPVEFSTVPLVEEKRVVGAVLVFRDITERKLAEESLRKTTEELVRSNQDLEQFAYAASHDLQEPLRMIAGYVSLLQNRYQGKLDEKADKYIAAAVDGAERMQALINDLLAFSRVNTRGRTPEPTDTRQALNDALRNLTISLQESEAQIHVGELPTVPADRRQLTQLFQNLIGNAIKFRSNRPSEIYIESRGQNDSWLFSVRDNGIGIEQQDADRIFLIFQRLHTRAEYPGTGIGLAICKKIVERHGGRIWVESQVGQGATFYFTLPHANESR